MAWSVAGHAFVTERDASAAEQAARRRARLDLVQRLVVFWFGLTVLGQLYTWLFAVALAYTSIWAAAFVVLYYAWILGPGAAAAQHDAPWGMPLRRLLAPMWRYMLDYFPARLVKTAELDPSGCYVFVAHPHGVTAISGWTGFVANHDEWVRLFPGIAAYPLTLNCNFRSPLVREYCLAHGLRSCSRVACANILTARPGNAIVVFPGGASEALETRTGKYRLVLTKRKGFCRIALQTGAALVPVLAFGETELFRMHVPLPGSWGARLQLLSHRLFGTSQPIFSGDSLFAGPSGSGLLPMRRPLVTVVGAPIHVPKWTRPATADVDPAGGHSACSGVCAADSSLHGTDSSAAQPEVSGAGSGGAGGCGSGLSEAGGVGGAMSSTASSAGGLRQRRGGGGRGGARFDPAFEAAVEELHGRYVAALRELWEEHKECYAPGSCGELTVVA